MDEIKERLKAASDACITTYEAWRAKAGDHAAREALQEAVHELRKVGARLEIELAVSDRKSQGSEPIPIPSHRASRRPAQGADIDMEDDSNNRNRNPGNSFAGGGRDGNRGERMDRGGRPVQIRRPQENNGNTGGNNAPAAAAAPAPSESSGEEGGERKSKPLSLKRTDPDAE